MDNKTIDQAKAKQQLFSLIQNGIDDVQAGRVRDAEKAIAEIMEQRRKRDSNDSARL